MGRGPNWTPEDRERLRTLIKDNEGSLYADIARKASAYGMFPGRSEGAIASQISFMLRPVSEPCEEQIEMEPYTPPVDTVALQAKNEELESELIKARTNLAKLKDALIYKARGAYNQDTLMYNFWAITEACKEVFREPYETMVKVFNESEA